MMLLAVAQVAKAYGHGQIFNDISFVINSGDHVGLVGANGAGKTTLLRIIAGESDADTGQIIFASGATLGYLPQQPPETPGVSVDDLIRDAVGSLRQLEVRLRNLEARISEVPDDFDDLLEQYGILQTRFERGGGYEIDYQIDRVFAGLGLTHLPRDREFVTLSGGEKTRVLLATLLLRAPDLLVLDEPTNHLDFEALLWLEAYLSDYPGTVLAASHDRQFLNQTVRRIIEIDDRTRVATEYVGTYEEYVAARAREAVQREAEYAAQQAEIRELRQTIRTTARSVAPNRKPRDPDKTAYDFKAGRIDVAIARNVRAAEERLKRIKENPVPKPPEVLRIRPTFDTETVRSEESLRVTEISKSFGDRHVLRDVSFTLRPGERVVIVGANGAGKSTLMNIIMGRETPDAGSVQFARGVRPGYLDQDGQGLDMDDTVLGAFRAGLLGHEQDHVNALFRFGFFRRDDLAKRISSISAGQRRTLQIARLIAEQCNLLLLDEPTNHLGFGMLEKFEHALQSFPGPILAASHDRWFIEHFRGHLWELRDGHLIPHEGAPAEVLATLLKQHASDAG